MDPVTTYFATQGILGVIIIMLLAVVIYLARKNDTQYKQISDLQDKRIADANQYTANYIAVAKEAVETNKDHLTALVFLQKAVDSIATSVQKVLDNK